MMNETENKYSSPRRDAYATMLEWCTRIGLTLTIVLFSFYVLQIRPPLIAFEELPDVWSQSAASVREAAGLHEGLEWLTFAGKSDFLALIGIASLACVSIVCLLRILPMTLKSKDYTFSVFLLLEIGILLLAASGVLQAGH